MKLGGTNELTPEIGTLELSQLQALLPGWVRRPWVIATLLGLCVGAYTIALSSQSSHWRPLFVIAGLLPAIGIIVGDLRRLLLAALVFDVPFSIGHHFGYNLDAAQLGSIGGLDVSFTTLAVPMLYALWIGTALLRRGDSARLWLRPAAPLALYVGFAILSIRQASNPSLSIFELFMLVQSLMVFIYIASTVRSREDVVFMLVILAAVVLLESLAMLATYATKHDFSFAGISTRLDPATTAADGVSRVGGTVGGPNAAAAFLDLLLAPMLALALSPVRRLYRLVAASAFVLGVVALILTLSRGGWIAVAVSCAIVVGYACVKGWIPKFGPVAIVVLMVAAVVLFRNELLVRFLNDDSGAASSRIPLMVLALHMIRDHPIFGVGANNFGINIVHYATPEFGADWLYTVHNKYLLVWAEDGLGALIFFITFLLATLGRGWSCRRVSDRALAMISVGLTAGVLAQTIHMAVDILNGRQQVQLLMIVAGLIAALVAIKTESEPKPQRAGRWDHFERPTLVIRRHEAALQPARVPVGPYRQVSGGR